MRKFAYIFLIAILALTSCDTFNKVYKSTDTAYKYEMAKAYYMNVFRGDGAGHMNPEKPVSREEAFVVLSRALSLENGNEAVTRLRNH